MSMRTQMMDFFRRPRWSPYVVGTGIGVLSWITFGLMGKALGTSTTMVRWAGLAESTVAAEHVQANSYFAKYLLDKPAVDWQMLLVIGLPLGALASAWMSRSYRPESVPELWKARFGGSKWLRYFGAFVGGALLLFGARLAGGCTSGHGISGGLQFSVSGWIFFASFFTSAIVAAFALFGREGRKYV